MAKPSTAVKSCWLEGSLFTRGRITAMTPRSKMPPLSMLRAHQMERRRSGIGRVRGEKAKTPESSSFPLGEDDRHEHGDEQQQIGDARRGQEVVREDALDDRDHDRGQDGDAEGTQSGDDRGGEAVGEGLGAEVGESGRRRRLAGEEDDREGREHRGERPHHGGDQLGRDRRQTGERGVGGAGFDGLADHGVIEEPDESDHGDRDQNQYGEIGAAHTHPGDRPRAQPEGGRIVGAGVGRLRDLEGDDLRHARRCRSWPPGPRHEAHCAAGGSPTSRSPHQRPDLR